MGALALTGGIVVTAGGALAAPEPSTPPVPAAPALCSSVDPAAASAAASRAAAFNPVSQESMGGSGDADQYNASWGAGYSAADADALAQLWNTDVISAAARAGQALLEGSPLPLTPEQSPEAPARDANPAYSAFAGSG